ncbi:uncharacterized protein LOC119672979 [Teleopsis dalmanni]|uniref:uncharacterized protein LOC119672979 n=1 Tax=Teleopsis dalmanni TaxID=139649 RepID=UPI000D329694|nr:uncharacterized protein LOC119672979 [Teleopsis dalmanni]
MDSGISTDEAKPTFTHLRTENQIRTAARSALVRMNAKFLCHYALLRQEMETQHKIMDRMTTLMENYSSLRDKPLKESNSVPKLTEERVLKQFQIAITEFKSSNEYIKDSCIYVKQTFDKFQDFCEQLDLEVDFSFTKAYHVTKPLEYYTEVVTDIYTTFCCKILHMDSTSSQLKSHLELTNDYKALLQKSEDCLEFYNKAMLDCKQTKIIV